VDVGNPLPDAEDFCNSIISRCYDIHVHSILAPTGIACYFEPVAGVLAPMHVVVVAVVMVVPLRLLVLAMKVVILLLVPLMLTPSLLTVVLILFLHRPFHIHNSVVHILIGSVLTH